MLQSLLAERFQLKLHRETKEVPMYALVVGKTGLKIKEGEFGRSSTSGSPGHLTAQKMPIAKLADFLSGQLGSPVTDMTGMKGFFDFTLEWAPDSRPGEAGAITDSAPGASVFTAVQERLGLKLEGRKGPVEMLVIEHVEKIPTGN
jgi:uncharacterized protein (TIGR03435 family)